MTPQDLEDLVAQLIAQIHEELAGLRASLAVRNELLDEAVGLLTALVKVLKRDPNPSVIQMRATIEQVEAWLTRHEVVS
jgi:hypothetical protein